MILDKVTQNVRSQINLSYTLQSDQFRKRLTSFSVGLTRTDCLFVCDFIALEIMESELAFHDDNFCKFRVPHAWPSDASALETRRRFKTELEKKLEPTLKFRPYYLGKNMSTRRTPTSYLKPIRLTKQFIFSILYLRW